MLRATSVLPAPRRSGNKTVPSALGSDDIEAVRRALELGRLAVRALLREAPAGHCVASKMAVFGCCEELAVLTQRLDREARS